MRLSRSILLVFVAASMGGCASFQAMIPWDSHEQTVVDNEYGEDADGMNHLIAAGFDEEGRQLVARDHFAEAGKFDIPVEVNDRVQAWIDYFEGRGRNHFARYLSRSGRYVPMMRRILKENGLPEDLVYLAMIESGFNPQAYSRARASGPWQFIYSTGRRYGLRVDRWIDERRDPEKSTIAAARYLKDLYDRYDDWYLAAAGYNAGEGKIDKAIRRYRTEDFWSLSSRRERFIRQETRDYVPKLIAAAIMAKYPEKYGFKGIDYHDPIAYDTAPVAGPMRLTAVAKCAGVDLADIIQLNPDLKRSVTPPHYPGYEIRLPEGTTHRFAREYAQLSDSEKRVGEEELASLAKGRSRVIRYRVRRGDSLVKIARKLKVRLADVEASSGLSRDAILKPGRVLKIRVRGDETASL